MSGMTDAEAIGIVWIAMNDPRNGDQKRALDHIAARLRAGGEQSGPHAHLRGAHVRSPEPGCLLCEAIQERDALRSQVAALSAQPAPSASEPMEMRICELRHVILQRDRPYVFTVDPNCEKCREVAQFGHQPARPSAPSATDVDFTGEEVDDVIDAATQRGTRHVPIECIEQMRKVLHGALSAPSEQVVASVASAENAAIARVGAEMAAEGASVAVPEGWQPIETAPRDGSRIVIGNAGGSWVAEYREVFQSGYRPDNPWQSCMLNHHHLPANARYVPATHWKPLAAAPVAPEREG